MTRLPPAFSLLLLLGIAAGEGIGPGRPYEHRIEAARDGAELILTYRLSTESASWCAAGRESAVLLLFVEGSEAQHLIVFQERPEYRVRVGPLAAGPHTVRLELHRELAPVRDAEVVVEGVEVEDASDAAWVRHAPILHPRRRGWRAESPASFTDVPLLLFVEEERRGDGTVLTYSAVWSNEDGGMGLFPPSLMALYGRTTDIEWVYRVELDARGQPRSRQYQGTGHSTQPFSGPLTGTHPHLAVASDNNNLLAAYKDLGWPPALSMAPIRFDGEGTRERVMDANAWTYRVADAEMRREKGLLGVKFESPGDPRTPTVSDARNYLYVEFHVDAPAEARWRFSADVDGMSYQADHRLARLQHRGAGWGRTAIEMPEGDDIKVSALAVQVQGLEGDQTARVCYLRAFRLGKDYCPEASLIESQEALPLDSATPRREYPAKER